MILILGVVDDFERVNVKQLLKLFFLKVVYTGKVNDTFSVRERITIRVLYVKGYYTCEYW